MSYNRGAVLTRLRVCCRSDCRLEVISVAGPGVCFQGALRACACHIISKFLAGSMLELVWNPQEYVYIMSLSNLEQILE